MADTTKTAAPAANNQSTQGGVPLEQELTAARKELEVRGNRIAELESQAEGGNKTLAARDARIKELEIALAAATDPADRVQTRTGSKKAIREAWGAGAESYLSLSKKFDVDIDVVRSIIEGK